MSSPHKKLLLADLVFLRLDRSCSVFKMFVGIIPVLLLKDSIHSPMEETLPEPPGF